MISFQYHFDCKDTKIFGSTKFFLRNGDFGGGIDVVGAWWKGMAKNDY